MKIFTKLIFLSVLLCLSVSNIFAQKEILQSDTGRNGSITFQRYDTSINRKPLSQAQPLLRSLLQMSNGDSLRLENTILEKGRTHILYQQYYKGYKVLYATYAVHAVNNVIDKVNGFFFKVGTPSVNVGVSEQTALANALSFVNAKKYGWEDSFTQSLYRQQQKDSSATLYPKGKLVIFYDDSITHAYRLVYQFPVYAVQPLIDCNVYIDAISGNVIYRENLIKDANTPGTATTLYSGVQNIVMDSYNTPVEYRLMETRTGPYGSAQIYTRNMHNTGNYGAWQEFNNATVNWNTPDGSLDVHWGTEQVFDYWDNVRQRNSYDNAGGTLIGYVHANLIAMGYPDNDNAFWDPRMQVMTYGDGTTHFHQVTSLDVIAHEIGHGVCQHTANLQGTVSNPEPQSLNEGLSDIWGAVIENWAAPNKQTWEIGEDIMADGYPCLRSLQNPRTGGDPLLSPTGGYPDTYLGQFWYNASNVVNSNTLDAFAHTNLTVLSHWFYLLSIGGTGWNNGQTSQAPTGSGYQWYVNGIGIIEAASIVWEAESNHLIQPSTNYAAIRNAMISAATNLYCANSPEVMAVTNAWYAVGVGGVYNQLNLMSVSGPSYICTSGTYTVINEPAGINSTLWSTSDPSVATINTSGVASKVSNGSVYIYANVYGSGCSTKLSTVSIPVGITRATLNASATPSCNGSIQTWVLSAVPGNFGSNWNWTVGTLGTNAQIYILSPNSSTTNVDVSGGGTVNLTYTDACGNNLSDGVTVYSTCHTGYTQPNFTVAPDPAQTDMTVSTVTNSNAANAKTNNVFSPNLIYGIKITDVLGTLRKSFEYKTGVQSVKISVAGLNPGVYSLSVFDGQQWQSQNIIIQK